MVNRCPCHRIDIKPIRNIDFRVGVSGGAELDMDTSGVALAIAEHNIDESSHPYILGRLLEKQDVINNLDSIISGASAGATAVQPNDNITRLNNNAGYVDGGQVNTAIGSHNTSNTAHNDIRGLVGSEAYNREQADIRLQGQIDSIVASSDVKDIVGTYAQLQNYDTSTLGDNDIIKVLQDGTQENATTYYRWDTETQTFSLIGEEGPYYTKSQADENFVPQTRTVNGKALSNDISLDAEDVGIETENSSEIDAIQVSEAVCEETTEVSIEELMADIDGYDSTKTQTLKNVNGNFIWIDD